ncbi:Clr5 domain-containing protein [Bisporella sp. PMI_857]|nr:Clr5 domain-containing protein [Bisporella sp. PMI_857]
MSLTPRQNIWASSQDWENHRDTIIDLYQEQSLQLKKVVEIMKEKHQFFATERMYKRRFLTWGIQKNFKSAEATSILRKEIGRMLIDREDFSIGHPDGDQERFWAYMRVLRPARRRRMFEKAFGTSNALALHGNSLDTIAGQTGSPSALLSSLNPPEALRIPEKLIYALRDYVSGAFNTRLWTPETFEDDATLVESIKWANLNFTANKALGYGKVNEAFRILNFGCQEYKSLVEEQNPTLFIATYSAVMRHAQTNSDVAREVVKYARDLAQTLHGPFHPLTAILRQLFELKVQNLKASATGLLKAFLEVVQSHLPPEGVFGGRIALAIAAAVRYYASVDNTSETKIAKGVATVYCSGVKITHSKCAKIVVMRVKHQLAWARACQGKNPSAREIVDNLLRSEDVEKNAMAEVKVFQLLLCVSLTQDNHETLLAAARQHVEFCTEAYGRGSDQAIDAWTTMEVYLRNFDALQVTEQARVQHDQAFGEMRRELEKLNLM